jgi:signal transduction histidine kinase/HAMP domain-containing protein/ActR/RegA family two-component response regulator
MSRKCAAGYPGTQIESWSSALPLETTRTANGKHTGRGAAVRPTPLETKDALKPGRRRAASPRRPETPDPYTLHLEKVLGDLLDGLSAARDGDLRVRLPAEPDDHLAGQLAWAFNGLVERGDMLFGELGRVSQVVGREGRTGERVSIGHTQGAWSTGIEAVNALITRVTWRAQEVSKIINCVSEGDLSRRMPLEYDGEALQGDALRIATTVNQLVDRLRVVSSEVTRVAREVGTEGKLGGQADVKGVSGTWKDLTDNVNLLAGNLTTQVRNIALVTTAVANGDLSQKITVEARGEIVELKNTVNTMVDQLRAFAAEVTRVAKEVGTEGKLGGQAEVKGVSGTWKDLTDNVNMLAGNLTNQVRNIALVTTAVANGDLSQKITVDVRGEVLAVKNTINTMVDQLRAFAAEVTRVAREVGTEGKLGGQAQVPGVAGTWKDLTDNVNFMASNLTDQVRGIVKVVTAVANGDLSQKFVIEAKGEIAALADTINNMTDTLRVFADQVTTVAREVGTEGKLGGQAKVPPGAAGTWRDLTDNVNMLAGNLTNQVRNIAAVTTAIAAGDLSQKITVDAKGEILELKNTINATVEQLRTFAREVTRVAREVGTEGKLGGQAKVPGVAGTWQDLTDNVNQMASNLTGQVRGIVKVVTAVAEGDLSQKLVVEAKGEIAALADTINNMTATLRVFADQVTTVAREVGIEGKLGGQARVPGASGTWRDLTDNVNMLAGNLTSQVRNIAKVTTAVANGDLSQQITVDAKGEILELKNTINEMVERLRTFAAEVTRVAREVGTEGKLGGQAQVPGVAGTWQDLTENVNLMASNLTDQVRGIIKVVTAVATGDLTKKFIVAAKGEIAAVADTINDMTDTLRTFTEQVTTVAREVGIDGKLGGQAKVPGAAGSWRDLTDNVNQLAGKLTTQVRAIADVATAVTKGDLTRTIDVEALGEVLSLKDTINQMIANLRDTTQTNKEQDWLKTNLAKFSQMMQGQRTLESLAQLIMSELTPLVTAQHGTFFVMDADETEGQDGDATDDDDESQLHRRKNRSVLKLISSYGLKHRKNLSNRFFLGESLIGQCALERKTILVDDVPPDYVHITSSVGAAPPRNILVLPILFEGNIKGVIELGSFQKFSPIHVTFLEQLALSIGVVFNMITASMRTEELLEELKGSNVELEKRTNELEEKASLLEDKNREIARASASLEEKARQLALVSKYKSEFLANMSHELRTPLNSLLILAKLLSDNEETNLSSKQVEYARTIHAAGHDLLALINQILDLSKIEAGKLQIEAKSIALGELRDYVESSFRQVAEQKHLDFVVRLGTDVPATITTDAQRLQQILKNLLSNAFKFTERGRVELAITAAREGTMPVAALAFSVTDTGIGIPEEKQRLIFEAFQQADASTSRTYGGTGLGLTISRELARLLGGEIAVESRVGGGSTFTLILPLAPTDLDVPYAVVAKGWDRDGGDMILDVPLEQSAAALAGKRVLVVDDDSRNLFAITSLLERCGIDVVSTSSGPECLAALEESPNIDLVLMDIMLPGMDGYQTTQAIRATRSHGTVPIIALTAKAMPGDREKCLEAGCTAFVAKPVDTNRLIQTMKQSLDL